MELPDHVLGLPEPLRRLGLRAGAVGQPLLDHRLRAAPQRRAGARRRRRFAAALLSDLPPAPEGQEAIVAANRAGSVGAPA